MISYWTKKRFSFFDIVIIAAITHFLRMLFTYLGWGPAA